MTQLNDQALEMICGALGGGQIPAPKPPQDVPQVPPGFLSGVDNNSGYGPGHDTASGDTLGDDDSGSDFAGL
jgi:hypothetical protein